VVISTRPPRRLAPVDAQRRVIRKPATPGRIGQDHEFGHDAIERRIAPTLHDAHTGFALSVEIEIETEIGSMPRLRTSPRRIPGLREREGQMPEDSQCLGLGQTLEGVAGIGQSGLGHQFVELVVAKIGRDPDALETRLGRQHLGAALVQIRVE